jgi:hypothetical protein
MKGSRQMRIKTVGLVIAGAAVVAGAAGGVAWAGSGSDAEPSVRIVQQEQPAPAADRDCPEKNGQQPAPAASSESL